MFYIALYVLAAKKFGSSRFRGGLRVAAYTSVITLAAGAAGAHKARAAIGEGGMKFGEDMASLAGMMQDAHTFQLNGQTIHTSTATTLEGVHAVLDKYEANCKASEGDDAPVWDSLPDTTKPRPKDYKPLSMVPIVRNEAAHKGVIVCIVPGKESTPHSSRALDAAVQTFNSTGNLGAVGKLRYAYVTENATGTSVFTVWTDDNFNMKALMPEAGHDAQGSDPALMARPNQTQRMFTGTVTDLPYRVYAYHSKEAPTQAIEDYDAQMHAAGWLSVTNPIFEGMPHEGHEGHAYIRNGFVGVVTAFTGEDGGTLIGIAEVTTPTEKLPSHGLKDSDGF